MRPAQDEADDVELDLKQAAPSQIGRASRSAVTPACSSPSADSPQEAASSSEPAEASSDPAPVDDNSAEWDYDPFIDPDAEPEPDEELTELGRGHLLQPGQQVLSDPHPHGGVIDAPVQDERACLGNIQDIGEQITQLEDIDATLTHELDEEIVVTLSLGDVQDIIEE